MLLNDIINPGAIIHYFINITFNLNFKIIITFFMGIGDWGLGIGVLGLGAKPQTPHPQPPPQTPKPQKKIYKNI